VSDFRGDLRFMILFGVLTGARIRISNSRCGESSLLDASSAYDLSSHEVERSLQVLECFGELSKVKRPQIYLQEEETRSLKDKLAAETGRPFPEKLAVIAPYSSKDVKSWPFAYFREVISWLSSNGYTVIIAGTPDDREEAERMISSMPGNVFSFAGKTSIRELAALVSLSTIVVGVDTGVLHIASCFDVPIIAIFGATRSVEFRPYSPMARVLETHTCKCNQFLHDKCDFPVNGYAQCLAGLSPATVISTINELIQNQIISEQ
jgi:ADP-heptose:LPS heptosyltransferase